MRGCQPGNCSGSEMSGRARRGGFKVTDQGHSPFDSRVFGLLPPDRLNERERKRGNGSPTTKVLGAHASVTARQPLGSQDEHARDDLLIANETEGELQQAPEGLTPSPDSNDTEGETR